MILKVDIEPLSNHADLSTSLVDYLLQRSLPGSLPNDTLVGSSNCLSYMEHYLKNVKEKDRTVNKLQKHLSVLCNGCIQILWNKLQPITFFCNQC